METAGLSDIKKELKLLTPIQVQELCLRLAKYKKENKELLSYLLFEASDEENYIRNVKKIMQEQFLEMNKRNSYLAKKTIRKVLRTANKYIKYSKNLQTEVELRLFFCRLLKDSGISFKSIPVLKNVYLRQIEKIEASIFKLQEDLQADYRPELAAIRP